MPIHYIQNNRDLADCLQQIETANEIAIDLEFDRNRYRYGFNMCLMQIYDGKDTFLVDPLANQLDITQTFPIVENPEVQKVVFAFGEDLRLFHSLGCFPKNILDLDIASSLLNYPPSSLDNLLKDVLDIEPGGSSQQSNWFRRPLSDKQKKYAASDVYHLLELKAALMEEAEKSEVYEWIMQENALHDDLDYSDEDHNNLIKEKDKKGQSEYSWFLYTRLMEFFDGEAQNMNKPVYQLIGKKKLKELAENPALIKNWQNTSGIYRRIKNSSFQQKVSQVLEQAKDDAQANGLAKNEPAIKRLSQEEYQEVKKERHRIGQIKSEVFSPLQDRLISKQGKHSKSYILPNRLVTELIKGEAEELPPYKKELFTSYARELDVDVSPYLD